MLWTQNFFLRESEVSFDWGGVGGEVGEGKPEAINQTPPQTGKERDREGRERKKMEREKEKEEQKDKERERKSRWREKR